MYSSVFDNDTLFEPQHTVLINMMRKGGSEQEPHSEYENP